MCLSITIRITPAKAKRNCRNISCPQKNIGDVTIGEWGAYDKTTVSTPHEDKTRAAPVNAKPKCFPFIENPAPTQPIATQKIPKNAISKYPINDCPEYELNSVRPIRAKSAVESEDRITVMLPKVLNFAMVTLF